MKAGIKTVGRLREVSDGQTGLDDHHDLLSVQLAILMIVINYLPVLHIMPSILFNLFEIFLSALMLLEMFNRDRILFGRAVIILAVSVLVNLLAFYHCWSNYTSIGSFMIKSTLCWTYMVFGNYFYDHFSEQSRSLVFHITLVLMLILSVTSLVSLRSYPQAVRGLGNGLKGIPGMERTLYLRNTATWSMAFGVTFFLPCVAQKFKETKGPQYLLGFALLELFLVRSQVTTAIVFSLCFVVLLVFKPLSFRQMVIAGIIMLCAGFFMFQYIGIFFGWLYEKISMTSNEVLQLRVYQLYLAFSKSQLTGTLAARLTLYTSSFMTFLGNPLIGYKLRNDLTYTIIGLHSQVLDLMAATGMTGIVAMGGCFASIVRQQLISMTDDPNKDYFVFCLAVLCLLMVVNPTYYSGCIYLTVFMQPVMMRSSYKGQNEKRYAFARVTGFKQKK